MKKYIEFAVIVASIIFFLVFINKFESCSRKKTETTVKKVNISLLRANLIDSLNDVHLKEKDSILKAKTNEFEARYKQLNDENKKLSKKYNELLSEYDSTPEIQTEICDKIVKSANNVIESQKEIIQNRDSLIEIKDTLIFDYKNTIFSKNEMLEKYSDYNLILEQRIKRQNNWWNRNKKWIYFGIGVVSGSLLSN